MAILADDGMDWMEKLKKYANPSYKNDALADYSRSQSKYNYQNSIGDTEGAAASKKWMNQIDTATGGAATSSSNKLNNLSDQYNTYLTNMMQRKAFDPATDATYQSALAAAKQKAQQGATTATNNAMVSLGARGIGNSSVAVDRANQIQQAANTQLQTQIEPQLLEQALSRYMQEQSLKQQDLTNLGNAVNMQSTLDQNAFNNNLATQQAALQQKQANLNAATAVGSQLGRVLNPKEDWSQLYNQTDAPLNMDAQNAETQKNQWQQQFDTSKDQWQKTFDENYRQNGLEYALKQMQAQASIANAAADNARQNAALGLQQQQFAWSKDPSNPDNQYKQAQIKNLSADNMRSETKNKIDNLTKLYTAKDALTGALAVTNPDALRKAIIANGSSESEIDQMLAAFGLTQ